MVPLWSSTADSFGQLTGATGSRQRGKEEVCWARTIRISTVWTVRTNASFRDENDCQFSLVDGLLGRFWAFMLCDLWV